MKKQGCLVSHRMNAIYRHTMQPEQGHFNKTMDPWKLESSFTSLKAKVHKDTCISLLGTVPDCML